MRIQNKTKRSKDQKTKNKLSKKIHNHNSFILPDFYKTYILLHLLNLRLVLSPLYKNTLVVFFLNSVKDEPVTVFRWVLSRSSLFSLCFNFTVFIGFHFFSWQFVNLWDWWFTWQLEFFDSSIDFFLWQRLGFELSDIVHIQITNQVGSSWCEWKESLWWKALKKRKQIFVSITQNCFDME